jgi:hypothetical protein
MLAEFSEALPALPRNPAVTGVSIPGLQKSLENNRGEKWLGDFLAGNCSQEHNCIQKLQDLLFDAYLTCDLLPYKYRIGAVATLYLGCLESKGIQKFKMA